ncbi:MAG: tetratricopeptide repeat protein [Chloroflexota bacterium]
MSLRRVWTLLILLAIIALGGWLYRDARPVALNDADAQTLRVARQLYQTGQTAEAAAMLQQLADSGVTSAEVYYNLGTVYQVLGDHASAIYYLRLAHALAPRDPDIQANLNIARSEIDAPPPRDDALQQVLRLVEANLSLDETALIALGLWLAFALLILITGALRRGVLRGLLRFVMLLVGIATLAAALVFGVRIYYELTEPPAVIVMPNVHPRPAIDGEANTRISLPPGSEVRVMQLEDGWARITLPGSQVQGWIPALALRPLSPFYNISI